MSETLERYERDDRGHLVSTMSALTDMQTIVDAVLKIERYGLSLSFSTRTLSWKCTAPKGNLQGHGETPAAAVFMWECAALAAGMVTDEEAFGEPA